MNIVGVRYSYPSKANQATDKQAKLTYASCARKADAMHT